MLPSSDRRTRPSPDSLPRPSRVAELPGLAIIFAQTAFVGLIMSGCSIETHALHRLIYIAAVGFVVHHLLPFKARLKFFAALSIVSMGFVLGGNVTSRIPHLGLGMARAGAIVGIGAGLVAICRLSLGFWKRAGLLLFAGLVVAGFRAKLWPSGNFAIVWPVLASMFMFRVMVYLYDASTSAKRPSWSQSLAYFFLIPNVCTLLFPVIDFRTFCQKYYDEEALVIYQRGVRWMARGVMHLLLYRVISQLFTIDPANVIDGSDLIEFVLTNSFLYLKVSGLFHLFAGMLLLFGFNLPETNHRYFLASSFTDYWRRVNTYWRVFIMKVFYYPAFFRCKSLGQTKALVLATLWSFFVTWAFHLYQTWWVKGAVSWTWPDGLFWSSLAVLVLANSLWELKRNRKRKLSAGYGWSEAAGLAVRTAATFGVISILWSLWSTPTLSLWLHIWSLADRHSLVWGGAALAGVMIATVLFEVLAGTAPRPASAPPARGDGRTRRFLRDAGPCAGLLLIMFLLTNKGVQSALDASFLRTRGEARLTLHVLRVREGEEEPGGYYENLTSTDEGGDQFSQTMNPSFMLGFPTASRGVRDPHFRELIPNTHLEEAGVHFDVNRWGMRDRDYERAKPPGSIRMALLGSSHVMGYALPAKDMFKPALEDRLNAEHRADGRFEIMNFAVGGQSTLGQIWLLKNRLPAFRPDIVLFVTHLVDFPRMNRDVVWSLRERIPLPAGFPTQILAQAGVTTHTPMLFAELRLRPYEPQMLSFSYEQIVRACRSIGALPVGIFLPVPEDLPLNGTKAADLLKRAGDAGFIVIDLSHIYDGLNPKDLMLDEPMHHANAKANAIIAAALYDRLTTDPRIGLLDRARRISRSAPVATHPR